MTKYRKKEKIEKRHILMRCYMVQESLPTNRKTCSTKHISLLLIIDSLLDC